MRRVALIALLVVVVGAAAIVVTNKTEGSKRGPIDVVFDDSRGLRPGQLVEIAGARVGKIDSVTVTPGYKARIHMQVEKRFLPFSANATCTIKPQGLIAENYVACDPGTAKAEPLAGHGGHPPTVPVRQTTQPVSLTDLFEVWNAPVRDRLRILFSELGIASSGRGQDFNDVLRRANPTLALAQKTISRLEGQRRELAQAITDSDRITREVARRPEDLRDLIHHAANVSRQTASHRGALAQGLRELPPLLRQARPSLQRINQVMDSTQPLLESLRVAAPDAERVSIDIPRLATAARPALRKLGPALTLGAKTARRARPTARLVRNYARLSLPSAKRAGNLFPLLERNGFTQGLFGFFYNAALAAARYDRISHIIPAHITFSPCSTYATKPVAGCGPSGTFSQARKASVSRAPEPAAPDKRSRRQDESPTFTPQDKAPAPSQKKAPAAPAPAPAPRQSPGATPDQLQNLLDMLLG